MRGIILLSISRSKKGEGNGKCCRDISILSYSMIKIRASLGMIMDQPSLGLAWIYNLGPFNNWAGLD